MEMHLKNKNNKVNNKKNVVWGLSSSGWSLNTTAYFISRTTILWLKFAVPINNKSCQHIFTFIANKKCFKFFFFHIGILFWAFFTFVNYLIGSWKNVTLMYLKTFNR